MKKNYIWVTIIISTLLFTTSCSKDDKDETSASLKSICLKWGSPKTDVIDYMKTDNEYTEDGNCIYYNNVNGMTVVTYQFTAGSLTSTSVLIPESGSSSEIESLASRYLRGYDYLGQQNSSYIYAKESDNMLAIIYPLVNLGKKYYSIGWTKLSQ